MSDYMQTETVSQQTVEFLDATPQQSIPTISDEDSTRDVSNYDDVDLGNFLRRPVRISTFDWTYNTQIGGTFNPWGLYFADTRIKNRLAYYNLLKCKLCLKFVINGNQFQYGKLMFDYLPLKAMTTPTLGTELDNLSYVDTTNTTIFPMAASHRQYCLLEPGKSEGACMELPFFWPENWLSIPLEEWTYLGTMRYYTLNLLRHANDAAATDPPRVSIFAWAEDVEIGVPTAAPPATLAPQAGKEPKEVVGKISGPATALSNLATSLSVVPALGPFAMATSMVASGVGGLAKAFGYSRPPIETPQIVIKPDYTGNLANTDRPESINKMTVDSSNELTIDPSVTGINRGDELVISNIAGKETYLTQFNWTYGDAPDAILWGSKVNPLLGAVNPSYTVTRCVYPTALMYASLPFRNWRGSIIYRFEVVCSGFHKGRLRVVYDPSTIPVSGVFNQNYNAVFDIQDAGSFEVKVNWGIPNVALACGALSLTANKWGPSLAQAPSSTTDNGAITVYVLNTLAVPNRTITAAQSGIYVNVFVRAGPDFELSDPYDDNLKLITTAAPFTPAAGVEPVADSDTMMNFEIGVPNPVGNRDLVLFGETVLSFRTLLKRYENYIPFAFLTSTTLTATFSAFNRIYPLFAGNDNSGVHTLTNKLTTGTFPGNQIDMTLMQYLMSAFSGIRGSVRYKYNLVSASNTITDYIVTALRSYGTPTSVFSAPGSGAFTLASASNVNFATANRSILGRGGSGMVAMHTGRNPLMELEQPYYSKSRFMNPKSLNNNSVGMDCHELVVSNNTNTGANNWVVVYSWIASGEDFNLINYTGPPLLWTSGYY